MDTPEIKGVRLFRDGVECIYKRPKGVTEPPDRTGDGIYRLSPKSLARLAFAAQNTPVRLSHMTTLTYPRFYPGNGREVKSHLNTMLTWARQRARRGGCAFSYIWFLEFQKRGAPHYHIIHSEPPYDKQELSERWYSIVASGDKKHFHAGTRLEGLRTIDGAAKYVTKYAAKESQKLVPAGYRNVGRFWGMSRDAKPECSEVALASNAELQRLLLDWHSPHLVGKVKYLYGAADYLRGKLRTIDEETGEMKSEPKR